MDEKYKHSNKSPLVWTYLSLLSNECCYARLFREFLFCLSVHFCVVCLFFHCPLLKFFCYILSQVNKLLRWSTVAWTLAAGKFCDMMT